MAKNPHEVLKRIAHENPGASKDEIKRLFLKEADDNPELYEELFTLVITDLWNEAG
jgi:hypothetical protein